MDKENTKKTQEMWRDYPNTAYWLKTISEPTKHMIVRNQEIIEVDNDYAGAVESLSYILTGKEMRVKLDFNQVEGRKKT